MAVAKAGSLTPAGVPSSTMQNLTTINTNSISRGPRALSPETSGTYTFANAALYCYNLSSAAQYAMDGDTTTVYTDWRLPTAEELGVFIGQTTSTNYIWTTTVYPSTNSYWFILNLVNGYWGSNAYNDNGYVRCVR